MSEEAKANPPEPEPASIKVHNLRTDAAPFGTVWQGLKTFEIRKDDRGFKVGDFLILEEQDGDRRRTGKAILAIITSKTDVGKYVPSVDEPYAVLSIVTLARKHDLRHEWKKVSW